MTYKAIVGILFITIVYSCNSHREESANPSETSNVLLDDKKDMSIVSKRSYEDLVEQLYREQVEKSKELQDIEKDIRVVINSKVDSLAALLSFDTKNKNYYLAAGTKIKSISDSALRSNITALLNASSVAYEKKSAESTSLIELLEKKIIPLEDYHILLKIKQTLPLLEKYQEKNQPSNNPIRELIKKYDQVIEKVGHKATN